jgi:hypothetical protein
MAHNLTLGGIVCEYIKDASGKVSSSAYVHHIWSAVLFRSALLHTAMLTLLVLMHYWC